jgi:hypothetical protein
MPPLSADGGLVPPALSSYASSNQALEGVSILSFTSLAIERGHAPFPTCKLMDVLWVCAQSRTKRTRQSLKIAAPVQPQVIFGY